MKFVICSTVAYSLSLINTKGSINEKSLTL